MKKILSLVMALMMCFSFAAMATAEEEIPTVTNEISYEGVEFAVPAAGVGLMIPKDWISADVTEEQAAQGLILNIANADATLNLQLILQAAAGKTIDDMWDTISTTEGVEGMQEMMINDMYFIAYTVPTTNSECAMIQVGDEADGLFMTFVFVTAAGTENDGQIQMEMMGSLYALEAE